LPADTARSQATMGGMGLADETILRSPTAMSHDCASGGQPAPAKQRLSYIAGSSADRRHHDAAVRNAGRAGHEARRNPRPHHPP
jgi:hypothetical protein